MKEKKKKRNILGRLQKTPLWKKEEFSEIEYEPTTVKDLMTEMKNISELIIDLAYSAVLFDSEEIAEEVKYLEVRMDKLNYDIRIMAMMGARTKEDAEQLAGILQVAQASEKISNTAGDIVLLLKDKNRPTLSRILNKADEKIFRVKISSNSEACDKNIGKLKIESESMVTVKDIMTPMVFEMSEDTPVQKAAETMLKGHIHRVLVTRDKKLIGIVSTMDMLKVIAHS